MSKKLLSLLSAVLNTCLSNFTNSHYWCFFMRGKQTFLFAYDFPTTSKSPWCHQSLFPLDLWHPGAVRFFLRGVCVAQLDWGSSSISTELWVCLLLTSSLVWARALCRVGKGLALLATNQRGKQACIFKGRASHPPHPPVIYSPHRAEVRHGHCLCTWAFIKQPGWALCRRHSNVQGAD